LKINQLFKHIINAISADTRSCIQKYLAISWKIDRSSSNYLQSNPNKFKRNRLKEKRKSRTIKQLLDCILFSSVDSYFFKKPWFHPNKSFPRLTIYEYLTRFSHCHSPPCAVGRTWSMVKFSWEEQYLLVGKH